MGNRTYDARRHRGLCPTCGRPRDTPPFVTCAACRERQARRRRVPAEVVPLGERLRVHREALGYSKAAFGTLLRITADHVSGLEHDTWPARPSKALQQRLAAVLGCTVPELGSAAAGRKPPTPEERRRT